MLKKIFTGKQKDILETILLSSHLAEIKEWDNYSHLERIKRYTYLLAISLGLNQQEANLISISSQFHDIGKIYIPDNILIKGSKLDANEWKITEKHAVNGAKLLSNYSSEYLKIGGTIALTHHERWDGSGYPNSLVGEKIPISGRICALADVFDALTTKRSYKKEVSDDQAFELIRSSKGKLFDPKLVDIFVDKYPKFMSIKKM